MDEGFTIGGVLGGYEYIKYWKLAVVNQGPRQSDDQMSGKRVLGMRCLKRTLAAASDRQNASTIMVICKDYIPQERNMLSSYIQASSILIVISFVVAFFFLLVYGKLIPVNFSSKNSRKLARRSEQGYPPFPVFNEPPEYKNVR